MARPARQGSLRSRWSPVEAPLPSQALEVDQSHPLARGLTGCYVPAFGYGYSPSGNGGQVYIPDLTGGPTLIDDVGGASTLVNTAIGVAGYGSSFVFGGGWQASASAAQQASTEASAFCRIIGYGTGGLSSYPMLFGVQYDNANSSPYDAYTIVQAPNGTDVYLNFQIGGSVSNVSGTGIIAAGTVVNLSFSGKAGTANGMRGFANGSLLGTATPGSGTVTYGANPIICMAGKVQTGGFPSAAVSAGYTWNRAITDDEQRWLNAEPFAFLRPVRRRLWFPVKPTLITGSGFFFAA